MNPPIKKAYNPALANKDYLFQNWYRKNTLEGQNNMPYSDQQVYDYYSFYKNQEHLNPKFSVEQHFPDTYKRPSHPTFSDESIYSTPENPGGRWEGEQYIQRAKGKFLKQGGSMATNRKEILSRGVNAGSHVLLFEKGGKLHVPKFEGGGKPRPLAGIFNREVRTENRMERAVDKAMSGKGSQQFRAATKFSLPSGADVRRGSTVFVTPQRRNVMTNPGTPGSPEIPGTPETVEQRFMGHKEEYTPSFIETGHPRYGKSVMNVNPNSEDASTHHSFNQHPSGMNPALKAALDKAIANRQPTAIHNGNEYKAGEITKVPQYENVVIPGSPGSPAIVGTPPTYESSDDVLIRSGGFGKGAGSRPGRRLARVNWLPGKNNVTEAGYANGGKLGSTFDYPGKGFSYSPVTAFALGGKFSGNKSFGDRTVSPK